MTSFILRRLVTYPFVLFIVLFLSFLLMKAAPGGPFTKEKALPAEIEVLINQQYHFDWPVMPIYRVKPDMEAREPMFTVGPLHVARLSDWGRTQFTTYMANLLRGDLGISYKYRGRTVNEIIWQTLPISLTLGVVAIIFSLLVGIPIGVIGAVRQNTFADYATMSLAMLGVCVPNFVLAPLLIILFVFVLAWLPAGGWGLPSQIILPAITLGAIRAAYIARLTRTGMLDVIQKDYVRTARAKGLSERKVIWKHTFREAVLPVLSYLGPAFSFVLVGSIVVEQIFNIPGMGSFFVQSALNRDYLLANGMVLIYFTLLVILNLLVDIAYAWVDPRIQYS